MLIFTVTGTVIYLVNQTLPISVDVIVGLAIFFISFMITNILSTHEYTSTIKHLIF